MDDHKKYLKSNPNVITPSLKHSSTPFVPLTLVENKVETQLSTTEPATLRLKQKVKQNEEPEIDQGKLQEEREKRCKECQQFKFDKPHVNIMFIGHVDAGKSTISGNILYLTGMVDERTIEKFKREAIQKNRDSWWLAYIMDSWDEEKEKGKTVEVGRAFFQTDSNRYTLLDAPGHQDYVQNMIIAAAQADAGILVISARQGEFERGFDRGGQTREHALITKTLNVGRLLVVINKMDEQTVNWSEERFEKIKNVLGKYLKKLGFKNVQFIPISGLTGENILKPSQDPKSSWYSGPTLLQALDDVEVLERDSTAIVRIPVIDRYKHQGKFVVMGKIYGGVLKEGDELVISPTKELLQIVSIECDFSENPIKAAFPGENVYLSVKGIDMNNINPGYILSDPQLPAPVVKIFRGAVIITNGRENNPIFTTKSTAVMHIHTLTVDVIFKKIICVLDKEGKPKRKNGKIEKVSFVQKGDHALIDFEVEQRISCDAFKNDRHFSTFTLRGDSLTLGIGKITKIL